MTINTTPIDNILAYHDYKNNDNSYFDWTKDYLNVSSLLREKRQEIKEYKDGFCIITNYKNNNLVSYHKDLLGTQTKTFVGEYRYWVWETNLWRVIVSNIKGICFEVPENSTKESALLAWDDYKSKMGLK